MDTEKYLNYMSLTIAAKSKNEAFARSTIGAFALELNPTIEELGDIKTAVSEAVTNSIVHGYQNNDGDIVLKAIITKNMLTIEIIDNGVGIEDIEKARQPFFTTRPNEERSGMGFTVMESFMDEIDVKKNPLGGLIVCMKKEIKGNNE